MSSGAQLVEGRIHAMAEDMQDCLPEPVVYDSATISSAFLLRFRRALATMIS